MPDEWSPLQWVTSVNMTNINWTNQWSQLIVEQGWKHQRLVPNGARSCPVDVGEEQQLCSGVVHLLLLQNSLCRELLAEAGVHRPGWCCPCRLGDSCLPHPAVPSDPQRDNTVFEPRARALCAVPRSLQKFWPAHGGPKEEGAALWCHCSPAEDSHTMGLHSLSSRAHSLCIFLTLPAVLPLMQVHFLLVLSAEAWPLKKINWIWNVSKAFKWILRFGWVTLRICVFKSGALLGQPSLIPTAGGTLSCSFWGDCKLRRYQAVFMESCSVSELAGTSRARWTLWYWILQLPNSHFDLHYPLGLIIFTPFPAPQAGFCSETTSESWPFLWKTSF